MATSASEEKPEPVSIAPLLKRLAYPATDAVEEVSTEEIAAAFALIFEDRLSVVQCAALLTLLHSTGKDKQSDVIAKCSQRMREAASKIEKSSLKKAVKARARREGQYRGGLVSETQIESALGTWQTYRTLLTCSIVRHCWYWRRFAFYI